MPTLPEDDPSRGIYGISVAAELVGTGPQNLRVYERHGLVDPERTEGGTRRYSPADLDRLRHIGELLAAGSTSRASPPCSTSKPPTTDSAQHSTNNHVAAPQEAGRKQSAMTARALQILIMTPQRPTNCEVPDPGSSGTIQVTKVPSAPGHLRGTGDRRRVEPSR